MRVGEAALVADASRRRSPGGCATGSASPCPSRVVARMLQPTGQSPHTVGTSWISHGRASNRYCVEVSAPTGQSSITLPENGARYGSSPKVAISRVRAAVPRDQLVVLGDVAREPRAAVAEDAALAVERDQRRDRDRLLERHLRERHPRRARAVAEGQVLQRALAALVADRAVERMVDEDELERRVLALRRLPTWRPCARPSRPARSSVQPAWSFGSPSTSTRHMRQAPTAGPSRGS